MPQMNRCAGLITILNILLGIQGERNNVCSSFLSYAFRDTSKECWYNPDVDANAYDLISSHGYPLELYEAITEDSYILQVFRIPQKRANSKGTVFLQHPVVASCSVWVNLGNRSLAFLLSDAGYDVWMGNFRGTIYSNNHEYLSPHSNKYWDFSFHEYGYYDLPAQLEVVKRETGNDTKVYYVGHSAGTSAAFVYSSLRPQHAEDHLKLFIMLSPTAYLTHTTCPAKVLAPFTDQLLFLAEKFHALNLFAFNGVLHKFFISFCDSVPLLCAETVMFTCGSDWKYADPSLYPILIHQSFAGYSLKVIGHYGQIYNSKRFQLYDYGKLKNRRYYHSKQPPLYPISNISVPMFFMYGGNDIIADKTDVLQLYNQLPSGVRYGIKNVEAYNHVDFLYSKETVNFVYNPVIQLIEEMATKP